MEESNEDVTERRFRLRLKILGDEVYRWTSTINELGIENDRAFAKILLDSYLEKHGTEGLEESEKIKSGDHCKTPLSEKPSTSESARPVPENYFERNDVAEQTLEANYLKETKEVISTETSKVQDLQKCSGISSPSEQNASQVTSKATEQIEDDLKTSLQEQQRLELTMKQIKPVDSVLELKTKSTENDYTEVIPSSPKDCITERMSKTTDQVAVDMTSKLKLTNQIDSETTTTLTEVGSTELTSTPKEQIDTNLPTEHRKEDDIEVSSKPTEPVDADKMSKPAEQDQAKSTSKPLEKDGMESTSETSKLVDVEEIPLANGQPVDSDMVSQTADHEQIEIKSEVNEPIKHGLPPVSPSVSNMYVLYCCSICHAQFKLADDALQHIEVHSEAEVSAQITDANSTVSKSNQRKILGRRKRAAKVRITSRLKTSRPPKRPRKNYKKFYSSESSSDDEMITLLDDELEQDKEDGDEGEDSGSDWSDDQRRIKQSIELPRLRPRSPDVSTCRDSKKMTSDPDRIKYRRKSKCPKRKATSETYSSTNNADFPEEEDLEIKKIKKEVAVVPKKRGRKRKTIVKKESKKRKPKSETKKEKKEPLVPVKLQDHPEMFTVDEFVSIAQKDRGKHKEGTSYKRYSCTVCQCFKTPDVEQFENHLSLHLANRLSCTNCDFIAGTTHQLHQHIRNEHENDTSIVCEICGHKSTKLELHRSHKGSIHNIPSFPCTTCGKCFIKNKDFKAHMYEQHQSGYKCDECEMYFLYEYNFKKHKSNTCQRGPFQCDQCGCIKNTKSLLSQHVQCVHTRVHSYQCEFCPYTAYKKVQIIRHERTHKTLRPYKCEICSFACGQPGQLKSHMRTHTGEKKYKCDQCNYAAAWKIQVRTHQKCHESETRQTCTICNIVFKDARSLGVHQNKEHLKDDSNATSVTQQRNLPKPPATLPQSMPPITTSNADFHDQNQRWKKPTRPEWDNVMPTDYSVSAAAAAVARQSIQQFYPTQPTGSVWPTTFMNCLVNDSIDP